MRLLKFLQLSDLHLDSSMSSGRLGLPLEKVRIRQKELRAVLPSACAIARQRSVDIVLIPGDLFDDEAVSLDTINFAIEVLGELAPLPVVIAPGNHDYYSLGSLYNNELLTARRQKPWPSNVKIFRTGAWEVWRPEGLPGLSVTGMAHAAGASIQDRLIAARIPRDEDAAIKVLIFHGSRDNTDLPKGKLQTLPFSDAELQDQGFDYAAIGHYHTGAFLKGREGRIIGAYAGCPAGRGLDETGPKSILAGEITKEGPGDPARVTLENIEVDGRRLHQVEVRCDGVTNREAILSRIDEKLALVNCREEDIVYIRLTGRVAAGIDLQVPEGVLAGRHFHAAVDPSRLRPAYDMDRYRRGDLRTTEARFAREMLRRIDEAGDTHTRRLLENALYYGLDALVQKEVSPRYEE